MSGFGDLSPFVRRNLAPDFRTRIEVACAERPGPPGARSGEGDERRLRGIPAIGRGVSGEIPGTRPDRVVGERDEPEGEGVSGDRRRERRREDDEP